MHIDMYIDTDTCIYNRHVCMFVCMYVCKYVCIYI